MNRIATRRRRRFSVVAWTVAALVVGGQLTGAGPLLLGGGEAHAIIGMPLTPMSYAGVARRTTRRAVYAGAAYGAYGYGAPTTTVVTSLPPSCTKVISGGEVAYHCGSTTLQPEYAGESVVYAPVH